VVTTQNSGGVTKVLSSIFYTDMRHKGGAPVYFRKPKLKVLGKILISVDKG
jgi:hypothetical protein